MHVPILFVPAKLNQGTIALAAAEGRGGGAHREKPPLVPPPGVPQPPAPGFTPPTAAQLLSIASLSVLGSAGGLALIGSSGFRFLPV